MTTVRNNMEYFYEFRFFVKETTFSMSVDGDVSPAVGIRLLEFPSLVIYPSDEAKKRYDHNEEPYSVISS